MQRKFGVWVAAIGSALSALSLTGSIQLPANLNPESISPRLAAEFHARNASANLQYTAGNYLEARASFLATASLAERAGSIVSACRGFNNAGAAALARQDYRDALGDFRNAERASRRSRQPRLVASTLNNIVSLYLQMGDPGPALEIVTRALSDPSAADAAIRPVLRFQMATALSHLHRFEEARPIYRQAKDELIAQSDYVTAVRVLASFGSDALDADRVDEADAALTEAMQLIKRRSMQAPVNVVRGLARVKGRQGHFCAAAALFDTAIQTGPGVMPRWLLYADRGEFRITQDDLRGALADFREAGVLAAEMRADIVPADQDRIAVENVLNRISAGLVESGNRLARETSDKSLLRETFDAAEKDRLWSLRALVPTLDDWRTRLPARYWDLLAQYQTVEGARSGNPAGQPSEALTKKASSLSLQLQQMETAADDHDGEERSAHPPADSGEPVSALAHVRHALDKDSVLLSFHITDRSGWLWAVDGHGVDVYQVPSLQPIKSEIDAFSRALQAGESEKAVEEGQRIYRELFGSVPASYLSHKRWLLELDGPLFDLPFAALPVGGGITNPVYLMERAALQVIPGALLLEARARSGNGEFLGIGDPVYNLADNRYSGTRVKPALALARLSATGEELRECSRLWGPGKTRLLTGSDASVAKVEAALRSNPSIVHFATHMITGSGEYASGMIALSLDPSGEVGLLGPREIVAHQVTAALVVLNGCHSGNGETLPSAGLMGLTRAWIGAGAGAVLATRWDIPDDEGRTFIETFYRALKAHPERGAAFALQQSQLELMRGGGSRNKQNLLAAYFLLGRA